MSFKNYPLFQSFLAESDFKTVPQIVESMSEEQILKVLTEIKSFAQSSSLTEDLGMEANRWFSDAQEAQTWLEELAAEISSSAKKSDGASDAPVKDSNGTLLSEGDAVTVIKDLKVKGGSSDLKRGTLIRKIHLIGDPENIECNVGGSTLVLKTCFLKKA